MASHSYLLSTRRLALAAFVGLAALFAHGLAQETAPRSWIRAGLVRPAADGMVGAEAGLGGTIYFAVYELAAGKESSDDPYNTGMPDFAKQFVAGSGAKALLPEGQRPRYLYVYQVVNDHGLDQVSKDGIRIAANAEVKSTDVGSLVLRLPADSKAAMSWGYFKNTGFVLNAVDRGGSGKIRPAATATAPMAMGASANPSVLSTLHTLGAGSHAKMALPVKLDAASGFAVDRGSKNLDKSYFSEELKGRKEKLVAWEAESMKSAQSGGELPDSVEIVRATEAKTGSVLRALFATNPLKPGKHSVLIGFTSDLAPGQNQARLHDVASAKKTSGIRTVSTDEIDFGAAGMLAVPKAEAAPAADVAAGAAVKKPVQLVTQGFTYPGDVQSSLIQEGSFRSFGGTVYFAVYRRVASAANATPAAPFAQGDTWGVGRSDFDGLFNPGESYRATVSPHLDTEAEYLYLYQVVNDRGFHDLNLPANKTERVRPVGLDQQVDERSSITREVASFSLFLKTDPRLITSWGYFETAGFNVKVPDEARADVRPVGLGVKDTTSAIVMAASSNLTLLDLLVPDQNKVYRPWAPAMPIERTTLEVGKATTNITKNRNISLVANDQAGAIRLVAVEKLKKVEQMGALRPDYTQILYFDNQRAEPELNIDGVVLGSAEVARAVFKVEWLSKPLQEGQHSVLFGFTSNAEPIRAPIRLKDLKATVDTASDIQERTFLSPERIKAVALASISGSATAAAPATGAAAKGIATVGIGTGTGTGIIPAALSGDANAVASAVAVGRANGIVPVGIAAVAAGSAAQGVSLSSGLPSPAEGGAGSAAGGAGFGGGPSTSGASGSPGGGGGLGGGGGFGGGLGTARPASAIGGGSGRGNGGGNGKGDGKGDGSSDAGVDIDFNASLINQQAQAQAQQQQQQQKQNQSQDNGGNHCGCNGNVIPAPPSLLLGLLGLPGLALVYRRRRLKAAV